MTPAESSGPRHQLSELPAVKIGEAFPAEDLAGQWVVELSMGMNDLTTLDAQIHDALHADRPEGGYFFRLLCGTLRELWWLFQAADRVPAIRALVEGMEAGTRSRYDEARALFIRPAATAEEPEPRSWAERHLKEVRDRTFHYPHVGSREMRDALASSASDQARLIDHESGGEGRRFEYADVVALQASFGNINQQAERERFKTIVMTAKRIAGLLVPVTWNALGVYLRGKAIDPRRLYAPGAEEGPRKRRAAGDGRQLEE